MSQSLVRIEHYQDTDPYNPIAYSQFLERMARLSAGEYSEWATVVFDSTTYMELAARYESQFFLNPEAKDPRKHYGYSKERLEQALLVQVASWQTNVWVVAHIDEDKDEVAGMMVRNPALPGKLSKRAPSGFGEFYRIYSIIDEKGDKHRVLQTDMDLLYNASTMIGAPDGCEAVYENIWANWSAPFRPPIHGLIYGESGSGKSTFVAQAPKPMLLIMFDPMMKETPYLLQGSTIEKEEIKDSVGNIIRVENVYE